MGGQEQPLVAVVTPVYNGAYSLSRAVESVLAQTYRNWVLVVVDNRSEDGTLELAAAHAAGEPRIHVEEGDEFLSMLGNWNRALSHVPEGAVYVKQLNADEVLLPTCLAEMVALAERHPRVAVVGAYRKEDRLIASVDLPIEREVVPGRDLVRHALLGGLDYIGPPGSVLMRITPAMRAGEFYDPAHWPPGNPMGFCRWSVDKEPLYDLLETGDFGFVHQLLTYSPRDPGGQTPFIWRLRAQQPGDLELLITYGPRFLTRSELRGAIERATAAYATLLAKQAVKLRPWRDAPFQVFHEGAARTLAAGLRDGGFRRAAQAMEAMAHLYATGRRGQAAAFSEPRSAVRS